MNRRQIGILIQILSHLGKFSDDNIIPSGGYDTPRRFEHVCGIIFPELCRPGGQQIIVKNPDGNGATGCRKRMTFNEQILQGINLFPVFVLYERKKSDFVSLFSQITNPLVDNAVSAHHLRVRKLEG